jgi:hypothetical protein
VKRISIVGRKAARRPMPVVVLEVEKRSVRR